MYLLVRSLGKWNVLGSAGGENRSRFCKCAIVFCGLMLTATATYAQTSVTLGWNQSTSSVAGYRVYQGVTSGVYTTNFDAGKNLQLQINGLTPGLTYYFAVSAYTSA